MIIALTEDYRINTKDSVCPLTIEKRTVRGEKTKSPGEVWMPHLYPGNMRGLEKSLARLGLNESEDLHELKQILDDFVEAVRRVKETTMLGGK